MSFSPYVFFSGDCAAAFARYHEVFGGDLSIMRNSEVPEADRMPGAPEDFVMHAAVKVGDALLMGSDDPTGDGGPKVGVAVSYSAPTADEARRVFDALAEGGRVDMPLESTFFSAAFGALNDRWGVPWFIDTFEQSA